MHFLPIPSSSFGNSTAVPAGPRQLHVTAPPALAAGAELWELQAPVSCMSLLTLHPLRWPLEQSSGSCRPPSAACHCTPCAGRWSRALGAAGPRQLHVTAHPAPPVLAAGAELWELQAPVSCMSLHPLRWPLEQSSGSCRPQPAPLHSPGLSPSWLGSRPQLHSWVKSASFPWLPHWSCAE
ncbi:hypothetical protein KIL84_014360 [Mauremys mutica]|uniref:Uncharacterized protein n=1 Tax=Mauremys mutica TaxID=74926 RepID=A0A9D3XLL3_9SAUR|nr:hypothetical protein KIL84_014360 [Mauremys mutica]